jgi:5-dehydro-2-deoxygluconokinase
VTPRGYDRDLYILAFDHRVSFETEVFGWKTSPGIAPAAEIAAAKRMIYDGFQAAIADGVPREKAGVLVDEQFGAEILRDASVAGFVTAAPAEKGGEREFDFEYGSDFAEHVEAFHASFCKVLVRYNPRGDHGSNHRQGRRLARLSHYLEVRGASRFMLELLVPATDDQLASFKGDEKAYDLELRARLMIEAIQELQAVGVDPDLWRIEGLDDREDCRRIVAATRAGGRDSVGCVILARGEDRSRARQRLEVAAGVPGFVGFAVGRASFWEPLLAFHAGEATREAAVAEIARRYREFVDIFEQARHPREIDAAA